jgi:Putative Actinobacterial Holin-X, holin superfamily III
VLEHPASPVALTNSDLLKELFSDAKLLAKRQFKLAQLEGKRQLQREKTAFEWLGTGGMIAYAAVIVLLVAVGLAIGDAMGGRDWLGALIVGGVLLVAAVVAGGIGWSRRVKQPLPRSRRELTKEITWARHQVTT